MQIKRRALRYLNQLNRSPTHLAAFTGKTAELNEAFYIYTEKKSNQTELESRR